MRALSNKKVITSFIDASLAITLTSCSGAGPDAATRMIKKVTDGAEASITDNGNNIEVSDMVLVATEDGSAVLVGTIDNKSDSADKILGIYVGDSQATLTGTTDLVPFQPVRFEGDSAHAKAVFSGVGAVAGVIVALNIGFAKAGIVKLNVIVRDKRDIYAGVTTGASLAKSQAK